MGNADLTLSHTVSPEPVGLSNILTYTLTVTNVGPDSATDVILNDTLPDGVTLLSVTCLVEDGDIACQIGTLAVGATATITITVLASSAVD